MKTERKQSDYTQKRFNEKLEKSSKLFTLLGLVLALFVVYVLIEYETKQIEITILQPIELDSNQEITTSMLFEKEITQKSAIQKKAIEQVHKEVRKIVELIKVVPNEELLPDEILKKDESEPFIDIDSINVVNIPDEIVEDYPIFLVEEAPVFPGCSGDAVELRNCLSKSVKKHINRKFDVGLGQELGLSPGKKKIFVVFKIDSKGEISDVMTRAPHPRLGKEAERVVKALPKMKPGRQGNKAVGVSYSIPISFEVQ